MKPDASPAETNAIGTELKPLPYVIQPCIFRSQAYDYNEAKRLLGPI